MGQDGGVKFGDLPWAVRVIVYGVLYGVLTALTVRYKDTSDLILKGVIAGVVLIVLFAPFMRRSDRRKAQRKAEQATTA
jgi:membrane associated rhomboid family serine protease